MTDFLPLSHPTIEGLTRVPIYRDPPLYTIRLSEDFTRVFTEDSLPDYIRTKIVIADAGFEPNLGQALKAKLRLIETPDLFIYRGNFNLQDTGWRYDKLHYIVVLNNVEFNTLLGKDNDGNT